eukprot:GHVS01050960.1.p1 GENE.GHVS01050960.1~~GHVS01050960.1.p1  ORF type:complete len:150 (+),score=4.71 GHVS01050960.1:52-501(+)
MYACISYTYTFNANKEISYYTDTVPEVEDEGAASPAPLPFWLGPKGCYQATSSKYPVEYFYQSTGYLTHRGPINLLAMNSQIHFSDDTRMAIDHLINAPERHPTKLAELSALVTDLWAPPEKIERMVSQVAECTTELWQTVCSSVVSST